MIPVATPYPPLRLVREEPDDALPTEDVPAVADLRRQLADARREAAGLRRRADALDDHLARLDGELRLAGQLQRDFLPRTLPRVGPARFGVLFRPAGHVSGDCYDVVRLDEQHVGFYVADAVGHGVPAALLTMFIRHALVTKQIHADGTYRLLPPGETLARLNDALLEQGLSADTFATAVYGVVNVATRQVTLARAGHPHPLVLAAGVAPHPVECDGGLLGVLPGEAFCESTFTLPAGGRLLLYTDGVEVAFATAAADSLRVWQSLLADHGAAADVFDHVADALAAVNGDAPPPDDLTLLTLELD